MGDPRRFHMMAEAVAEIWPDQNIRYADIAAGKGYLRSALYQLGYQNGICFDKRPNKAGRKHYQYRYFDRHVRNEFDLLLGMHPDEATDIIITEAARRQIPFVIVPCCAYPTVSTFWGSQRDYKGWMHHIACYAERLGFDLKEQHLRISGRNTMLIGRLGNDA